ncbi:hemolysin family protein [Methylocapsa acidiphila]|uniref:hemolysin family protein n=1 Tax=Methylocapsa acidiphila TaxID=133552 RepID=UPI000415FAC5|nr:hemolysin family protein [Methylocapsa acidiphila]
MTTERDMLQVSEGGTDRPAAEASPSLFERLRALFGLGGASIRDDIQDALADTSTDAGFSPHERAMLKNVLSLHAFRVADVMVPRADIISVSLEASLLDVLATFRSAGHSRLPVHGDTLDDPRGMVHIRDFVAYFAETAVDAPHAEPASAPTAQDTPPETTAEAEPAPSRAANGPERSPHAAWIEPFRLDVALSQANILRPVLFVPPSMPALDLLLKMQATRTHMALVIDEYGGTEGLATIEDIVETIVGDIEDEHDLDESPKIDATAEGAFIVDARASLEDVSNAIEADLTELSDAEEVDTLGGLISSLAGHVPVRGEIIVEGGLEFEVLDADPRRVKRIKIHIGHIRRAAASGARTDHAQDDKTDVSSPGA